MNSRFLYLVGQLGPGGLERQLYLLLQSMDRLQYRPRVVVWNFRPDECYVRPIRDLGIPVDFFSAIHTKVEKLVAFRRLVLRTSPEIVHSFTYYTNVAAWWAARNTNAIPIGSIRSDFTYERNGSGFLLGRLSGRWPRYQICNSFYGAKSISRQESVFVPENIAVVTNGVDLQAFTAKSLPDQQLPRILAVGSLLPVKRWDRLIKAALQLKLNGLGFVFQIAGDGPLRRSLEDEAQKLGVADRVQFLGYSSDIPGLLAKATFLVHCSETEGTPNAVMEAMACGRAVVAMDAGDIPSLIDDGKTGFVIRPGDEVSFVERLATLIADRELCRQMGQAGRAKAEREFGLDSFLSKTLAAYKDAGWKD